MSQSGATAQWLFQDIEEGESQSLDLKRERQKLLEERRKLEKEKKEFCWKKQIEEKRLLQEKKLFEMKWKILEEELQKLAKDKQEVELQKEQYYSEAKTNSFVGDGGQNIIKGKLFFSGVGSESAMKKRYKDLIKIFHPDNMNGDNDTLLEINREYDNLKKVFGI